MKLNKSAKDELVIAVIRTVGAIAVAAIITQVRKKQAQR